MPAQFQQPVRAVALPIFEGGSLSVLASQSPSFELTGAATADRYAGRWYELVSLMLASARLEVPETLSLVPLAQIRITGRIAQTTLGTFDFVEDD